MNYFLGSSAIAPIGFYAGSTALTRIYQGEAMVWDSDGAVVAPKKLAGIGDSTIAEFPTGIGLTPVPTIVGSSAEITPTTLAVPGHTINQQLAVWNTVVDKTVFDAIVIQVGLNDVAGSGTAAAAITRLQTLVNTVRGGARSDAKLLISKMLPCKQRWINLFGASPGLIAQQQWVDINDAIAGAGSTPITGVDGRIVSHAVSLADGSGNLAAAYDTGDSIHENNAGRTIIAAAWRAGLIAGGVLAP